MIRVRARQLLVMTVKELRQLVRDRLLLGFVVYIFSVHIVISTIGASFNLRRSPTLVHDGAHAAASRELVARLQPPFFDVVGEVADPRAGARALDRSEARMVLDIPADLARTLGRGDAPAHLQLVVDTSKVTLGFLASSYTARIVEDYGRELAAARLARLGVAGAPPRIECRERSWYNFTLDDRWSMSVFILLTMMTVACVMLPATAAVREKERGTIEQLLVSPLTPLQIMIAKVLAMILVTVAGTLLAVYGVLRPIFGVPMRGSAPLFFAMVALYAFTMSGLGLVLATLARTSAQTGLLVILTVMPILQLSGTVSPVESMPPALQHAVELSPLHHLLTIAYGIIFRGEGLATLWPSSAAMIGIGAALFAVGLWRFRAQLASR